MCSPGYYLQSNNLACVQQVGIFEIDLFVLEYTGYLMAGNEISQMQSVTATFGENLGEPFMFLQQVHNSLSDLKADTLGLYAEVTVNVYLGAGDHYLFNCATDYNEDLTSETSITDFCTKIPTL